MIRIQTYQETAVCGVTMVIILWMALGLIVVSIAIALLGCKRSKTTLSEIAEKLERQVAARSDPNEGNYIGNLPRCYATHIGAYSLGRPEGKYRFT
jgi:heme exporter protein D